MFIKTLPTNKYSENNEPIPLSTDADAQSS